MRARRRVVGPATLAAGLALAAVAAGCGANPVSLSLRAGTVSVCYRGLPTARAALHDDQAKLRGVHRVPVDRLEKELPAVTLPAGDNDTEVCAYSFRGTFHPGQVTGAPPDAQGPYAVILVSSKQLRLVASYVGGNVPSALGERLAGGAPSV